MLGGGKQKRGTLSRVLIKFKFFFGGLFLFLIFFWVLINCVGGGVHRDMDIFLSGKMGIKFGIL
jgi:hypothetical protein